MLLLPTYKARSNYHSATENRGVVWRKYKPKANNRTSMLQASKSEGKDSTKGLLISPTKMLVDFYVFEIESMGIKTNTLFLSSGRIRKLKFVRVD